MSPRSQATRSGGRSGNRLCCDATQNQGPVSQSHAGRSPLALKGLAGQIWTLLGVVQQPTIVWLGSCCQARGRAAGQRGELCLAGTGVEKSVCLFTICAQIAGESGPTLGVGGRVPVFSVRWNIRGVASTTRMHPSKCTSLPGTGPLGGHRAYASGEVGMLTFQDPSWGGFRAAGERQLISDLGWYTLI